MLKNTPESFSFQLKCSLKPPFQRYLVSFLCLTWIIFLSFLTRGQLLGHNVFFLLEIHVSKMSLHPPYCETLGHFKALHSPLALGFFFSLIFRAELSGVFYSLVLSRWFFYFELHKISPHKKTEEEMVPVLLRLDTQDNHTLHCPTSTVCIIPLQFLDLRKKFFA